MTQVDIFEKANAERKVIMLYKEIRIEILGIEKPAEKNCVV